MMEELVSVIVPVYNVSKYLRQCLDSIVQQSYRSLEIILINDGSTDDSLEICQEYALLDKRIVIINQVNSGNAAARNKGIQIATADFLMFVDSDDWLAINTIETVVPLIEKVDLVCFSFTKQYVEHDVIRKLGLSGMYQAAFVQRRITGPISEELSDPSHLETLTTVWGKIYRASIIKQYNIFSKSMNDIGAWEDGLFNWEYLNHAESVFVLDVPLYQYRKFNANSITSNYKSDFLRKTIYLFDLMIANLKSNNKSQEFYDAFSNRICLSVIGLGIIETYNKASFFVKLKNIKAILNSRYHKEALAKLSLNYFPVHWKLFFFFAKYHMVLPLYFMLVAIKRIIRK